MAKEIKILSYNCRGLNNYTKRQKLFSWFQNQKLDIIMLQETFCTNKLEPYLRASWKGEIKLTLSDSSHSRGVAILFQRNFAGKVLNHHSSKDGRLLIVNIEFAGEIISLVSLYAPNNEYDRIAFFKAVTHLLKTHCDNLNNIVVGGDFNTCVRVIDRHPTATKTDHSIAILNEMMQSCQLIDVWSMKHPTTPGFTYFDKKTKAIVDLTT